MDNRHQFFCCCLFHYFFIPPSWSWNLNIFRLNGIGVTKRNKKHHWWSKKLSNYRKLFDSWTFGSVTFSLLPLFFSSVFKYKSFKKSYGQHYSKWVRTFMSTCNYRILWPKCSKWHLASGKADLHNGSSSVKWQQPLRRRVTRTNSDIISCSLAASMNAEHKCQYLFDRICETMKKRGRSSSLTWTQREALNLFDDTNLFL